MRQPIVLAFALIAAACGAPSAQQGGQSSQPPVQQAGGSVAKAPCDNTYVPVKDGAKWTYKNTNSVTAPLLQVTTITNVGDRQFTETVADGNGTTWSETWSCVDGGLLQLQNNGGAAGVAIGKSGKATVTTKSNTGLTIPTDPKPGDKWSQTTESVIKGAGITVTQKTTTTSHAVGMESVTVAAGSFDALRVEGEMTGDITYQDGKTMHVTGKLSVWLVPGKGLVKAVSSVMSIDSSSELQSFQIP